MKIRSDIKSGNFISDVNDFVLTGIKPVTDFVVEANNEAKMVTQSVSDAAVSTWDYLTRLV